MDPNSSPSDQANYRNSLQTFADFAYAMNLNAVKIQANGKGLKSVAEDLAAVLQKIENWHSD